MVRTHSSGSLKFVKVKSGPHIPLRAETLLFNSPQFHCSAQHNVVWDIPLASVGQLSCFCAPPVSWLAGQREKLRGPWPCVSTALQELEQQCVSSSVLILNPEHNFLSSSCYGADSVPAEIRTFPKSKHAKTVVSLLASVLVCRFLVPVLGDPVLCHMAVYP